MKPRYFMIAALALSLPAIAHASDCIKANNQCTPVVGCIIGAPNELFAGEVRGVGNGTFVVKSNQGATCSGTFKRTPFGTAKVKTTCDDGRTGKATFSYYHKNTGTGRGKGRMSDGDKIVFWAGDRLWPYFQHVAESKPNELIDCAVKAMEQSSGS